MSFTTALSNKAWSVWWIVLCFAPWLPTGTLGVSHAGRVWLCVAAILGVALSAITVPKRTVCVPGLTLIVLVGVGFEAWRSFSLPEQVPWLYRWSAWWDTAGWLVIVFAGVLAAIRNAVDISGWLPKLLSGLLCLQIFSYIAERFFGVSRWIFHYPPFTGLLASQVEWAALCAISLPILWSWKWVASIPALIGLVLSPTSSSCAALIAWSFARRGKVAWKVFVLLLGVAAIVWQEGALQLSIAQRLQTWLAVSKAILVNPFGIGWGYGAYREVALYAPGSYSLLPHPASDWLMLPFRYGWWAILAWAYGSLWLWKQKRSPMISALLIAWFLSAWQTSLSYPTVAALILVIFCNETIRRCDGKTKRKQEQENH